MRRRMPGSERRAGRAGLALGLVCLAAACAARQPASLAHRFVVPAGPDDAGLVIDLPAADPDCAVAPETIPAAEVRYPPPAPLPPAPTLESVDPELAGALAAVATAATADHFAGLADAYLRRGVYDQAEAALSAALALSPRDARLHDRLARLWRDWGLPGLALPHAHRAVFYDPQSPDAWNTQATILGALGLYAEAESALGRAAAIDPSAPHLASNRCYVAMQRGDEAGALARCGEALRMAPDSAHARNNLALIHATAGRFDDAAREFQRAGGRADGLFNVGIAHLARRDYLAAADAFDAASAARPAFLAAIERAAEARRLAARSPIDR